MGWMDRSSNSLLINYGTTRILYTLSYCVVKSAINHKEPVTKVTKSKSSNRWKEHVARMWKRWEMHTKSLV
jgi:hypothetical protein